MIFRQITNDDLGCASYVVGDARAGVLAVVDPKLDVSAYLGLARELGARIAHVVETHTHADHVSGHGALAQATGATIHVHRDAGAAFEHEPVEDGWELELGTVRLRAMHTPGHRPEHTAFTVTDTGRGPEPWAVLTGDSLFVGDVARPDLAVERERGARDLFESLRTLLGLPDHTEVWPGHLGGSLCGGASMDAKPSSTVGYERRHNHLLRERHADRFLDRLLSGLAAQPPNFQAVVARNRGPLLVAAAAPPELTAAELDDHRSGGALVVDVRPVPDFTAGHVPGALSAPLTASGFATRLARAVGVELPLVLVGEGDADAGSAARRLAAIGVDTVVGRLRGGMAAWVETGGRPDRMELISVDDLRAALARADAPTVIDVRDPDEWAAAALPDSVNAPYHALRGLDGLPAGVDASAELAVICAGGTRSALGASLLRRLGARNVVQVAGGLADWERRGWPLPPGA